MKSIYSILFIVIFAFVEYTSLAFLKLFRQVILPWFHRSDAYFTAQYVECLYDTVRYYGARLVWMEESQFGRRTK